MANRYVSFLNPGRPLRRDDYRQVAMRGQRLAGTTRQRDSLTTKLTGFVGGLDYAWRLPAGTDCNQHVTGRSEGLYLSREDYFVTKIVAYRRQRRRVGGQRYSWESSPLLFVAAHEFGSNVLRISGATAITAKQNLVTGLKSFPDQIAGSLDLRESRLEQSLYCLQVLL